MGDKNWVKNEHGSLKKFLRSREKTFYYAGPVPFSYISHEGMAELKEFAKKIKLEHGVDEQYTINEVKRRVRLARKKNKGAFDENSEPV